MFVARSRKRAHVSKQAHCGRQKERGRLIPPPSRDDTRRAAAGDYSLTEKRERGKQDFSLNFSSPLLLFSALGTSDGLHSDGRLPTPADRSIMPRRDESMQRCQREQGLRLQTPQIPYQAPPRDGSRFASECTGVQSLGSNSMMVLNPEQPYHGRGPAKGVRDRRLATRHGFPNPNPTMQLCEARTPASRQGIERKNPLVRHSISSQASSGHRFPCHSLGSDSQGRFLSNHTPAATISRSQHRMCPIIQEDY